MILEKKYSGITVPVLTPVLEDETVDEAGYRTLIKYLLDNGVHGVFALLYVCKGYVDQLISAHAHGHA